MRSFTASVSPYLANFDSCLTLLHGQTYATPAIIGLASRKVYRHRVEITTAAYERSTQYGSQQAIISSILSGATPENVIEIVLAEVEVPV